MRTLRGCLVAVVSLGLLAAVSPSAMANYMFDMDEWLGVNTAPGYTSVVADTAFTPAQGYGWHETVRGGDKDPALGFADVGPLLRDFNYNGIASTFGIAVPDGSYHVKVYMGDLQLAHANMRIEGEGLIKADNLNTAIGEFITPEFHVLVNDGELDLTFSTTGVGGDGNWVVNGIEVSPAPEPATLGLLALGGVTALIRRKRK